MMVGRFLRKRLGALGEHSLPHELHAGGFFGGFFLEGLHQGGCLLAGLVYLGIAHFAIAGDDFGEAEQLDTVIVGIGLI